MIAIPIGATPIVEVISYTEETYKLDEYGMHRIMPRQPSVCKSANPEDIKFIYNDEAYTTKGFIEKPIAEIELAGNMRGVYFGFLNIKPVVYDASTNTIKVRNNIEIEVKFKGGDKAQSQNIFEKTYSPYFSTFYNQLFNKNVYDDNPDLYKHPVYMLVVADRKFENVMQPWLNWKTKKGFYLDVNYTDEIGTSYSAIKNFIKNKYNNGVSTGKVPTFVVLFGDTPQIPATYGTKTNEVTDLYYGSIDGDIYPEMFCSRMCCETTSEMSNLIEKVLVYEQYTMADPSYLNNVLLIAGYDYNWNPIVGQPTIKYATQNYFNAAHGYTGVHSYLTSPYTGCYNYLSSGVAHAHYTAHGSNTSWANPSFSVNDVNNLTNVGKYFLAIGNCCIAADYAYNPVCFGEALIRANKKGAYSYIGSAPSTYWNEDYYWAVGAHNASSGSVPTFQGSSMGAFDAMFKTESFNTVNSTNFAGLLAVSYAHEGSYPTHSNPTYYWEAYNVLGDGSIMPYLSKPDANIVSHSNTILMGVETFTVSAAPLSLVALSKDGVLLGTALIDESGTANVPITPVFTSGNIDLVITCPQKIPYVTQLTVSTPSGPYLSLDGYILAGDGILSYGETTDLSLRIKNVGVNSTTSNSTVTISCANNDITINNATGTCPAISPNQVKTVSGFNISVANNVENGTEYKFDVTITNNSNTWEDSFYLTVYKPELSFENYIWEGSFAPNTTSDITVCYKNEGGFKVSDVNYNLTSNNSNIIISPTSQNVGVIEPNETKCATFAVTFGSNISSNEVIPFNTNASGDNGNITANSQFSISNACNIVFEMHDSYGDGWNLNGRIQVSFDDGSPSVEIRLQNGYIGYDTINVNTGIGVSLQWVGGYYNNENSFKLYYEFDPDNIIYETSSPSSGFLYSFTSNCGNDLIVEPITNLNGTVNGNNVNLTWNHPNASNVDSYIIYCDGVEIGTTNNLNYTHFNNEPGTYNYCVVAVINGSQSEQVCIVIVIEEEEIECNPITNLNDNVNENNVTLSWNAPADSDTYTYKVYRNGSFITNTSNTTFTQSNLEVGSYNYCVEANKANCVAEQVCVNVTIEEEEIECNPITNLNANVNENNVTLSWNAPADSDTYTYKIYRNGNYITTISNTTFAQNNLDAGNYNYCVEANKANCIAEQVCVNVTIEEEEVECNPITNLNANVNENNVTLSWNAPADNDTYTYKIYRNGNYITTVSNTSFAQNNLEAGIYNYCVEANKANCVAEQVCVNVTIEEEEIECNPITNLNANVNENNVTLSWNAPADSDTYTYKIYRNGNYITTISNTTFAQNNLDAGIYNYCVEANKANCIAEQVCVNVTIEEEEIECNPITNLDANVNNNSVTLSWDAPVDSDTYTYKIYRDGNYITTVSNTTFTQNNLTSGTYNYCIEANKTDCIAEQVCIEVTIDLTGIDDSNISVFPNPTNNIININGIVVKDVRVYNNLGQLVDIQYVNVINVSKYLPGIYLFNIRSEDGNIYKVKVVKQ
jgi:hypothetical protein